MNFKKYFPKFGASLLLSVFFLGMASPARAAGLPAPLQKLYQESKRLFYREDFDGSLDTLKKYFNGLIKLPKEKVRTQLRFSAIVSMGRIYLKEKQDPAGAIEWFQKIEKTEALTAAERDIIDGWIAGCHDWIKLGKFPKDVTSDKDLFELGSKYYQAGLAKQKNTMDPAAAADFSIASAYLVPLIVHFDKSPSISDALFMMGDIRRRSWADTEYWSESFYLTEVIRRNPGTKLAQKAYQSLNEDVEFGYSGSSGSHVPNSWTVLLGELKKVSDGKTDGTTAPIDAQKKIQQVN
jgi:hypothetical protein